MLILFWLRQSKWLEFPALVLPVVLVLPVRLRLRLRLMLRLRLKQLCALWLIWLALLVVLLSKIVSKVPKGNGCRLRQRMLRIPVRIDGCSDVLHLDEG
jgi:hypothetical protein